MEWIDFHNSLLALLLQGENASGEPEWIVRSGNVQAHDGAEALLVTAGKPPVSLLPEWASRVKVVKPEVKAILHDADYVLSLSVGNLSPDADPEEYQLTGISWPDSTVN